MHPTDTLDPIPVKFESLPDDDAHYLLTWLDMARDITTSTVSPKEALRFYSEGMRLGRRGGFTMFYLGSQAVAMTHTTQIGMSRLEVDALARTPSRKGERLGARALSYTLTMAAENDITGVGLFAPHSRVPFYNTFGFEINQQVTETLASNAYVRMNCTLPNAVHSTPQGAMIAKSKYS